MLYQKNLKYLVFSLSVVAFVGNCFAGRFDRASDWVWGKMTSAVGNSSDPTFLGKQALRLGAVIDSMPGQASDMSEVAKNAAKAGPRCVAEGAVEGVISAIGFETPEKREEKARMAREMGADALGIKTQAEREEKARMAREMGADALGIKTEEDRDRMRKAFEKQVEESLKNLGPKLSGQLQGLYNKVTGTTVLGCVAVIASWWMIKIAANEAQRRYIAPKLIIESNMPSTFENLKAVFVSPKVKLHEMIFNEKTEKKLDNFAKVTAGINRSIKAGKKNIFYKNLVLQGPSGTGKTMYARELSKKTGIPYVLITGSSFSKFKSGEGVREMDRLFAWSKKLKTGLILVIDEADSFLIERHNLDPESDAYLLVNNFLHHVGEGNNKFMVVMCTNHIEKFDKAALTRSDIIEVPSPKYPERLKVLALYTTTVLLDKKHNSSEFVESAKRYLNDDKLIEIAKATKGLSNRELRNIINSIKTSADVGELGLITQEIVYEAVAGVVEKQEVLSNAMKDSEK